MGKDEHQVQKEVLSSTDCFDVRQGARDFLRSLATPGSAQQTVIDLETLLRNGDTSEPDGIYCRSIMGELARAMSDAVAKK